MIRILASCLWMTAVLVGQQTALAQSSSTPTVESGAPAGATKAANLQIAVVSIATEGEGLPPLRANHGDWQVRCETPPGGAAEHCALMQAVVAEVPKGIGLSVIVLNAATPDTRMLRVLAPLGVLLPGGLGLRIDDTVVGITGFARCLPNGCVAEVVMDDNLVKQMRTGQTATFIIFQTPEEGIGFPMALKGFGEGYDKLP